MKTKFNSTGQIFSCKNSVKEAKMKNLDIPSAKARILEIKTKDVKTLNDQKMQNSIARKSKINFISHSKPLSQKTKLIIHKMLKQKHFLTTTHKTAEIKKLNIKDIFDTKPSSKTISSCRTHKISNNYVSRNSLRRLEHKVKVSTKKNGKSSKVIVLRSLSPLRNLTSISNRQFLKKKEILQNSNQSTKNGLKKQTMKIVKMNPCSVQEREEECKKKGRFKEVSKENLKGKSVLGANTVIPTDQMANLNKDRILSEEKNENIKMISNLIHKTDQILSINKTLQNISFNNLTNKSFPVQNSLKNIQPKRNEPEGLKPAEMNNVQTSEMMEGSIKLGLKIPSKDLFSNENSKFESSMFLNTLKQSQNNSNFKNMLKKAVKESLNQNIIPNSDDNEEMTSRERRESILIDNKKFDIKKEDYEKIENALKMNYLSLEENKRKRIEEDSKENTKDKTEANKKNPIPSIGNLQTNLQEINNLKWEAKEIMTFRQELPNNEENLTSQRSQEAYDIFNQISTNTENPFKQSGSIINNVKISYLTSQMTNSDKKPLTPILRNLKEKKPKKDSLEINLLKKFCQQNSVNLNSKNQNYIFKKILETVCPMSTQSDFRKKKLTPRMASKQSSKVKKKKNYSQKFSKLSSKKNFKYGNKEKIFSNVKKQYHFKKYTKIQLKKQKKKIDVLIDSYRASQRSTYPSRSPQRMKNENMRKRRFKKSGQVGSTKRKKNDSKVKREKSYVKQISAKIKSLKRNYSLKNRSKQSYNGFSSNRYENIYKEYWKTLEMSRKQNKKEFKYQLRNKMKRDFVKKKLNLI
jgi:hypothetical protein